MNPLVALLVASSVQLTAVVLHAAGLAVFPLIIGILSCLFIVGVMLAKSSKSPSLDKELFKVPLGKVGLDDKPCTVDLLVACILFILWAIGAGVFTFQGPFTVTSNVCASACSRLVFVVPLPLLLYLPLPAPTLTHCAPRVPRFVRAQGYFACWGALAASAMHMKSVWVSIPADKKADGDGSNPTPLKRSQTVKLQNVAKSAKAQVGALLVCNIVTLFAAVQGGSASISAADISAATSGLAGALGASSSAAAAAAAAGAAAAGAGVYTPWENTLAIVVSCILLFEGLVLVVMIEKLPDNAVKGLAFTMLGLAGLMAFICTFRQPFNTTGNGYFGAWLGLVAAMAVSVPLLPEKLRNLIHPDGGDGDGKAKVVPM